MGDIRAKNNLGGFTKNSLEGKGTFADLIRAEVQRQVAKIVQAMESVPVATGSPKQQEEKESMEHGNAAPQGGGIVYHTKEVGYVGDLKINKGVPVPEAGPHKKKGSGKWVPTARRMQRGDSVFFTRNRDAQGVWRELRTLGYEAATRSAKGPNGEAGFRVWRLS